MSIIDFANQHFLGLSLLSILLIIVGGSVLADFASAIGRRK